MTEELRVAQPDLLGRSLAELETLLEPHVDRPYRVAQIYRAIYRRGVSSFSEMTDLGKGLRQDLTENFSIGRPEVVERQLSGDSTAKVLFRLADGATIEAVDIPSGRRRTLCLSSQAGCALACKFCVTGFWGAGRDLTAGEILGQVLEIQGSLPEENPGLNLVFMGMGEPLSNLGAVAKALEILTETISWRRITISTAGVVPGIEALSRWEQRPNLAISLHATDDERRSRLMPLNNTWPLAKLMSALRAFPLESGRRLTFEYLLIDGFNDSTRDARTLSRMLSRLRCKVNLIPVNPDPVLGDRMVPPPPKRVEAFREEVVAGGVFATVRERRGDEVSAACGQLRASGRAPRGFRRSNLNF